MIEEAHGALEVVGGSLGDTLTLINTNMSRLHELEENTAASDAGRTLRDIQRDLVGTLSETRRYHYMEYSDNQLVTMVNARDSIQQRSTNHNREAKHLDQSQEGQETKNARKMALLLLLLLLLLLQTP